MSTIDHYAIGGKLGEGATAKVYEALDDQGNSFAIKVFDHSNPRYGRELLKYLREETNAAFHLNHKNVVRYVDFKENAVFKRPGKQGK